MNVSPQLLIIEDEPEVAEHLDFKFRERFEARGVKISTTDNLEDAAAFMANDAFTVLIADVQVKETRNSIRSTADAQDLLRMKRDGLGFMPTVVHSAYRDKLSSIERNRLADVLVSKVDDFESTDAVITKGTKLANDVFGFREGLLAAFHVLESAAQADDVIEKQSLLTSGRSRLGEVVTPSIAPRAYRETVSWLAAFVMRLSAVPSERFVLVAIDVELCEALRPLVLKLLSPRFDYKLDAEPVISRLGAKGYPVTMRLDI